MILLKNVECLFPSKVENIRLYDSCQIRLTNLNVNIPSFLLGAINCLLWSHVVIPLQINDFSNRLTYYWLLTSHMPRPCNWSIKNHQCLSELCLTTQSVRTLNVCSEHGNPVSWKYLICTSYSYWLSKWNDILSKHING